MLTSMVLGKRSFADSLETVFASIGIGDYKSLNRPSFFTVYQVG